VHIYLEDALRQNDGHIEHTGHQKSLSIPRICSGCVVHNIYIHSVEAEEDLNGVLFEAVTARELMF
jgi:hypothetical protein